MCCANTSNEVPKSFVLKNQASDFFLYSMLKRNWFSGLCHRKMITSKSRRGIV